MNQYIDQYLESKRYAWAPTTLVSERHRLNALMSHLNGNPETLWIAIQERAPYTRLTIWTRTCDYVDWLISEKLIEGPNEYKKWRKTNAKVFKNAYVKVVPKLTFDEALQQIQSLSDIDTKERALDILSSGLRYKESLQQRGETVTGKGSKVRTSYRLDVATRNTQGNYQRFRRTLSRIGLKPHDLRKLFLTRLVELGINEFQLCEVAGWSSISTASSYIKANSEQTKLLVKQIHGDILNATKKQVS